MARVLSGMASGCFLLLAIAGLLAALPTVGRVIASFVPAPEMQLSKNSIAPAGTTNTTAIFASPAIHHSEFYLLSPASIPPTVFYSTGLEFLVRAHACDGQRIATVRALVRRCSVRVHVCRVRVRARAVWCVCVCAVVYDRVPVQCLHVCVRVRICEKCSPIRVRVSRLRLQRFTARIRYYYIIIVYVLRFNAYLTPPFRTRLPLS